jgi:F-type H+-transporting ATPase subunit c
MSKKVALVLLVAVLALLVAPVTFAQAAPAAEHATNWVSVAAAIALGIAAAGCGIGQGMATGAACEGAARNPGAFGSIRLAFILGVVFIESLTLYALLIVLIK